MASKSDGKKVTIWLPGPTFQRLDEFRKQDQHQSIAETAQGIIDWYLRFRSAEVDQSIKALTRRLREVLQLIGAGYGTKQIARSLGIGLKTVEWHRKELRKALNTRSTAGLVHLAIRSGLVSL